MSLPVEQKQVRSKPYRDDLLESLKNPVEAAAYLDAVLEGGIALHFCWRSKMSQMPTGEYAKWPKLQS